MGKNWLQVFCLSTLSTKQVSTKFLGLIFDTVSTQTFKFVHFFINRFGGYSNLFTNRFFTVYTPPTSNTNLIKG